MLLELHVKQTLIAEEDYGVQLRNAQHSLPQEVPALLFLLSQHMLLNVVIKLIVLQQNAFFLSQLL